MSKLTSSIHQFIDTVALTAYIKTLEAELSVLKEAHQLFGMKTGGRKPGRPAGSGKSARKARRGKHGEVKNSVLAFLEKNRAGKAIEIANLTGLKVTSVNQTLFGLKKSGHVTQDKKRGSPFVLAAK